MTRPYRVIRSRRVVLPDGERPASIHIGERGTIARIGPVDDAVSSTELIDLGDAVLMPGIVDTHVHINEPGRAEWEGFQTATKAAAAGGVTTVVDMPLNSIPPTRDVEALAVKRRAAQGRARIDVGFWGGLVPGNERDLVPLARAGVLGFKCFLVPSGVDEFPPVTEADLRRAAPFLVEAGLPLLVHAELPGWIDAAWTQRADPRSYRAYAASRPAEAEVRAIQLVAAIAREWPLRVHIVHVSSSPGIGAIARARRSGVRISGETCPHYLFADETVIADGATAWKCAPPIRSAADRDALWQALGAGALALVASDHSPSPPSLKCLDSGDFARAWGGIASLQLALPIVWTGARARGYAVSDVARWMCGATAALAGLSGRKGAIVEGADADLVAWDPDGAVHVDPRRLFHRHHVTPYAGQQLFGRVDRTWLRGACAYDRGMFSEPRGALIAGFH